MSSTTFDDVDAEAKAAAKAKPSKKGGDKQELAKSPGTAVSTYAPGGGGPDPEDINIEHIQILGKSSHFDPEGAELGDICVNKETPIMGVGVPMNCVLVHTRKYWKENVPYEDDTVPRFANTIEEKKEIEASTEFDGTVPVCDVTVLLERPETFTDDDKAASIFIYAFGGHEYALVKYTVQKPQAVRENYGTINVAAQARKTQGDDATRYYFQLRSKEKGEGTKFKWHQFVLNGTAQEAPEDAVQFAASLRGE